MLIKLNTFIAERPHLAEMLKGGFLSLFLRVGGAIFGFLLILVITRLLGAEESGYYFLMLSVVTVLATLIRLGFDRLVTRHVAAADSDNNWLRINGLYSMVMRWVLVAALILVALLFMFAELITSEVFDKPRLLPVWNAMLWAVLPFALYMLHGYFFQGLKRLAAFMFASGLGLAIVLLLLVGVYWGVADVFTAYGIGALYSLASFVVLFILVVIWWRMPQVQASSKLAITEFNATARSLWSVQALSMVVAWSAPILLGLWAAVEDVAVFSVAFRTAMLTSIVLTAVNSIAAPKFAAQYHQGDMKGLHQIVLWSTRLMLLVCAPVVGFLLLFPEWVMSLFGDEFTVGSTVLTVLALGQLVNVATGSVGILLTMTGHEKDLLKSTMVAAILMLSLCAWLIPAYGMMGAAIAQAASMSVQMLLNSWFVKRALGFVPLNVFVRV